LPKDIAKADLALLNGRVRCMDAAGSVAEAVAIRDGRIAAVGRTDEIGNLCDHRTEKIDLRGRALLPGFIESHVHAEWYGRHRLMLSFAQCRSKQEILDLLRQQIERTPPGEWVAACAVPIRIMEPGSDMFALHDLDSISPQHPVAIDCASTGHCMLLNSVAMRRFDIDRDHFPDDRWNGDGLIRDADGNPTGRFEGHAWNWVLRAVKPYTFDWYLDALDVAQRDLLQVGITSAHSAWEDPYILKGWQALETNGRLRVRTFISLDIEGYLDEYIGAGLHTNSGSDMLRLMFMKIILNVPPRAAMLDDYCCASGYRGYHLYPPEWVEERTLKAVQNGWSVCAHSTGDADTEMLVTAFEKAIAWHRAATGKDNDGLRLRLEHTMYVTPELIERIARARILVNVRPCGRLSPGDAPNGPHARMVGHDRWSRSRPIKPFVDRGLPVNFGCDYPAPCGFLDPCASLFSATGGLGPPWDVIGMEQALRCYTIHGAYGLFAEERIGSIERGKLADLVIYNDDPATLPPERIWDPRSNSPVDLRVDCTLVGGKIEYQRA
jgi:predicted amidohydrolase YtcJ